MKQSELKQLIREIIAEAEVDAQGNLVNFNGGDWKSQVDEYDHIHFFIEPQMADRLEDKLIMAGIDMVDNYPYKGAHLLRVSLGTNAAADLVKAEKIVGQSAKKGSPEDLGEIYGHTDASDNLTGFGPRHNWKQGFTSSVDAFSEELAKYKKEEAIIIIDRFIDYLKDRKADIEYKISLQK